MKKIFVIIFLIALTPGIQAKSQKATSSIFLEIPPGARPISLGEAYTASGEDPYTIFYNPAGLAERPSPEVTFNRYNFFNGIEYNYIAGGYPMGRLGHIGGSFTFMRLSTTARDIFGNDLGTIRPYDYIFNLTYAKKLIQNFNIGGSIKIEHEDLHDYTQTSFAIDMGAFIKFPLGYRRSVNLAFSVRNLGRVLPVSADNDPLPLVGTFGASVHPVEPIKLYAEVYLPENADVEVGSGVEYGYNNTFFIRGGFRWSPDVSGSEIFRGGLGWKVGDIGEIDYAYQPRENYRAEHRFSFTLRTSGVR